MYGMRSGETHSEEVEGRVDAGNNKAGEGSGAWSRSPSESEMGGKKAGVCYTKRRSINWVRIQLVGQITRPRETI